MCGRCYFQNRGGAPGRWLGSNINVGPDNCEVDCRKGGLHSRGAIGQTRASSSCLIASRPLHKYVAVSLTPLPICEARSRGGINVKPRRELWLPRQFPMNSAFSAGNRCVPTNELARQIARHFLRFSSFVKCAARCHPLLSNDRFWPVKSPLF